MLEHLNKYDIILGSGSPRRSELLSGLNIPFRIETNDAEELLPEGLSQTEIPIHLAKIKASTYSINSNTLLITADTIVWKNGKVYGKPTDYEDGKKMLEELSGKKHQVITGVCIKTAEKEKTFAVTTDVIFAKLSDEEIDFYLKKHKPYDKAGAYGIQEWIGFIGVERIEGSYFNVMGLPIQRLYCELKNWE